jgi:hypothetical protein
MTLVETTYEVLYNPTDDRDGERLSQTYCLMVSHWRLHLHLRLTLCAFQISNGLVCRSIGLWNEIQ